MCLYRWVIGLSFLSKTCRFVLQFYERPLPPLSSLVLKPITIFAQRPLFFQLSHVSCVPFYVDESSHTTSEVSNCFYVDYTWFRYEFGHAINNFLSLIFFVLISPSVDTQMFIQGFESIKLS
jgi:hypothetical protein